MKEHHQEIEKPSIEQINTAIEVLKYFSGDSLFDHESTGKTIGSLQAVSEEDILSPESTSSKSTPSIPWWKKILPQGFNKAQFEKEHLLDQNFSVVSSTGWRIRHPLRYVNIEYTPNNLIFQYDTEECIKYRTGKKGRHLNMHIDPIVYVDSNKLDRIMLRVFSFQNNAHDLLEEWLLRSPQERDTSLYTDIVHFNNPKKDFDLYARIKMSKQKNVFEFQFLDQIKKD